MFADKTVFVEALTPYASDINKESYIAYSGFAGPGGIASSALKMNIQPASDQMTLLFDGVIGKTFVGYTTNSGIVEGMRLTVSGTNDQYMVQGRKAYFYGPLPHAELVLFKRDPL